MQQFENNQVVYAVHTTSDFIHATIIVGRFVRETREGVEVEATAIISAVQGEPRMETQDRPSYWQLHRDDVVATLDEAIAIVQATMASRREGADKEIARINRRMDSEQLVASAFRFLPASYGDLTRALPADG